MKSARRKPPRPIPGTWAETLRLCPYRSFIGQAGSSVDDMARRLAHTFAALGGELCPIEPDLLEEMANSIGRGQTVLVIADRADLRDCAKREILARVYGAARCA